LAKGDTQACRTILESLPPDYKQDGFIPYLWARLALYNRDYAEGARILAEIPSADLTGFAGAWVARDQAFLARARGDAIEATPALLRALEVWQARVNPGANESEARSYVALWQAALGHKEDAISESQKAVNLIPLSRDATNAPTLLNRQALVYAWCGEHDRALKQLAALTKIPGGASPGDLKLNPGWDDLRDEPRFDQIVAAVSEPFKFE
jgi:tetratricopeptide (TPR) repeat protein